MDENELSRRLHDAANAVSIDAPSLTTVASPRSSDPRRGWIAAGVALLAVAGGTAVMLARGDGRQQVATVPTESVASPSAATPSTTENGGPGTTAALVVESTVATPETAPIAQGGPTTETASASVSGPETSDVASDDPPEGDLIERTVGELTLRYVDGVATYNGFLDETGRPEPDTDPELPPDGVYFVPSGANLPADCNYSIEGTFTLDGVPTEGPALVSYTPGPADVPRFSRVVFDVPGGPPVLAVVVHDAADAVSASVNAFGLTDETQLTNGSGLLLISVTTTDIDGVYDALIEPASPPIEVDVTTAAGAVVTATDTEQDTMDRCSPPPMPAAGPQPDDPDAAYQAFAAALQRLTDASIPTDQKRELLNDWSGVDDAVAAADPTPSEVRSWQIGEYVFTSPTEVWFFYRIFGSASGFVAEGYGRANLVDGEWQFRREMLCESLLFVGSECAGGFGGIGAAF